MIKKFRRRFLVITMVLVAAVSLIAFSAIGVMNYQSIKARVDEALTHAVDVNPMGFDRPSLGFLGEDDGGPGQRGLPGSNVPVYSVTVYSSDMAHIIVNSTSTADMDEDVCDAAVSEVLASEAKDGLLTDYGLYYKVNTTMTGYKIAFADSTSVLSEFGERVLMLAVMWVLLMVAMFFIALFLSRFVSRPVERAWAEQQRFIADASHELKTPLTVIMADASILAANPQSTVAEQSAWVEGITAEAGRMQRLTEDMLALAQADAGLDMEALKSELDFSALVEGQALGFDAVAFERGLQLDEDVEPGLKVVGDEIRLENLVKTLLENACKYADKPSTVSIALHRDKGELVLSVSNIGPAIPPEDLPHLFDRFYRSDKSRVREGETASFGLGLSIAKSTAESHGGTIGVTSSEGLTVFTVRLPLAR